jgi:hypothetical protein
MHAASYDANSDLCHLKSHYDQKGASQNDRY